MNAQPPSLLDLRFEDIKAVLHEEGVNPRHAAPLWRALYRDPVASFEPEHLTPPLARWCQTQAIPGTGTAPPLLTPVEEIYSTDALTRKFLLRLRDGQVIETVLMGYDGRHTVCVSTQAGCAMGCVFCATGQMGFVRHLSPGEIVAQVLHARKILHGVHPECRVRNLVLMGMGEPLHNYDQVTTALEILSDVRGVGIGPSKIAISTVGIVPAIRKMADTACPYRLAVSLHGSSEEERSTLVPVSTKWPLASLMEACHYYTTSTGKRIFFEWTLIRGKNDSLQTAQRLIHLLDGINAHVNLIPLNPTEGFQGQSSESGLAFQQALRHAGIPCTFRQRRGIDVAAGCGMLKAQRAARIQSNARS